MKRKLLQLFLACVVANSVHAATGDTTTVTSHNLQKLSWYENYDSLATFPNGTLSYRAIIAEFELGKYMCDGYDPSNPGEGTGQTGWCGDWDYDVHLIAMTSTGDTVELGELITPYANSNFPNLPWSWKHKYYFDVTDYYQILKDDVTIRIFYAGWSGGFTATVKFHFIEGPRHRDVLSHQKLYHGNYKYGIASDPIETKVAPVTIDIPTGTQFSFVNTIISGHGNVNENCAEFCSKWMKYLLNETEISTQQIWRDDCGSNWLSPQSGTWVYDRANWCPGNKVEPMRLKLSSLVFGTHIFDINFQPFTATGEGASYKMYTDVFHYGNISHNNNAGIERILAPSDHAEERKLNPVCANPKINVKNYGSAIINKIKIEYGISTPQVYIYTGSIAVDESADIELPNFPELKSATGSGNTFYAKILEVNETPDTETFNNHRTATFSAPEILQSRKVIVHLKTTGTIGGTFNTVSWKIYNDNNEVVMSRVGTTSNTNYRDSFELPDGCYRLETETPRGMGLSFFNYYGNKGFVRLYNGTTGVRIPMYDNDLGSTSLEGNFGNGFTHYFKVYDPTSIDEGTTGMKPFIFPNPAQNNVTIQLNYQGNKKEVMVEVIDALGKKVLTEFTDSKELIINTSSWSNGLYFITINDGNARKTEKLIIAR